MPVKAIAGGFTFSKASSRGGDNVRMMVPNNVSPPRRRVGSSSVGSMSLSPSHSTVPANTRSSPTVGGGTSSRGDTVKRGTVMGAARRKVSELSPQPLVRGQGRMSPSSRLSPASQYSKTRKSPSKPLSTSRNLTSSRGGGNTAFASFWGQAPPISTSRDRATIDPFDGKDAAHISAFANAYNNRDLPCRLVHGSVAHHLDWETDVTALNYDPVVVIFAQGLVETRHPYHFVARQGLKDLLTAAGAGEKTTPLVSKMIAPIRSTLVSSDPEVYQAGIAALCALSNAVGAALNPHVKMLLGQLAKNVSKASFRDQVTDVLNILEENGGNPCYKLIKAKIPTYCTINVGQF